MKGKTNFIRYYLFKVLKNFKFIPQKQYVKILYEYYTKKRLDLKKPVEFNEKIQWLKVFYRNPLLTQLSDKYCVRDYVKEKIGEEYLNELYGVYYNFDEINFDSLPQKFVLKGAHGSHFNLIVQDKTELDLLKTRTLVNKWLKTNFYYKAGLEWAYKNIKPKIIAEKYLEQIGKQVIDDYKFFCFNGKPKFIQIDIDKDILNYRVFYDLQWNKLPFRKGRFKEYTGELKQPSNFDEMTLIAEKLAENLPFVRVDLYNINSSIIFGEMTFYPADGKFEFKPDEYNKIIGQYLNLPNVQSEHDKLKIE